MAHNLTRSICITFFFGWIDRSDQKKRTNGQRRLSVRFLRHSFFLVSLPQNDNNPRWLSRCTYNEMKLYEYWTFLNDSVNFKMRTTNSKENTPTAVCVSVCRMRSNTIRVASSMADTSSWRNQWGNRIYFLSRPLFQFLPWKWFMNSFTHYKFIFHELFSLKQQQKNLLTMRLLWMCKLITMQSLAKPSQARPGKVLTHRSG